MEINNPIRRFNLHFLQSFAEWFGALAVCAALFSFRIHTLVPGFSQAEKLAIGAASSLKNIAADPSFLPHKFLQYLGLKLDHTGYIAMRLPSVIAGLLAAALFFYILNKWFNLRIATITTFLMVTSSWFLHIARVGVPEVMFLGILAPLAYGTWLQKQKRPIVALLLGAVIIINTLYTPGLIWFTLIGAFWQRKAIIGLYKEAKMGAIFTLFGCLVLLVPLIVSFVHQPHLIETYLGLPSNLAENAKQVPKNLIKIPIWLAWKGPLTPETNLATVPLLDFFTIIMATLGAYSYATFFSLQRSRMLLGSLILCCVLISLGGKVTIFILLPFVYLLVASGLNFMIEQWFKVFPYNPFARATATLLLTAAVGTVTFYHMSNYFIAWPQAPATKATYNQAPHPPRK